MIMLRPEFGARTAVMPCGTFKRRWTTTLVILRRRAETTVGSFLAARRRKARSVGHPAFKASLRASFRLAAVHHGRWSITILSATEGLTAPGTLVGTAFVMPAVVLVSGLGPTGTFGAAGVFITRTLLRSRTFAMAKARVATTLVVLRMITVASSLGLAWRGLSTG